MTKIMKEQKELFTKEIIFYEKEIVANIEKLETSSIGSDSRNLYNLTKNYLQYYTGAIFLAYRLGIVDNVEKGSFLEYRKELSDLACDTFCKYCC